HQRERAFRIFLPGGEAAGRRGRVGVAEAFADVRVERIVLLEPFIRPGRTPEREHLGGGGGDLPHANGTASGFPSPHSRSEWAGRVRGGGQQLSVIRNQ